MYLKKILLAIVLIGLLLMAGFAYYVYNAVFIPNTAFNNNEAHIYIPSGATFSIVMEELSPILKDPISFKAVANRKGYPGNIKSGHYIIKKGMNNNDIVNSIRIGNVPIIVKFNNQERLENLAGSLSKQLEVDSLSFLKAFRNEEFLKKTGFNQDNALSMYIPNSYEVYWNISAKGFQERMYEEYQAFWNTNRIQKATDLALSKEQVISLAAIVQKETAKVDERQRVAGVYINRIKRGMPLQADPTVIYTKKMLDNDFEQEIKRVLYEDLELDSPYNTYQNTGTPPGPITMPDISSIDAVLNFEKHNYYYFVADVTNFGYHKFAKTLSQHNRNKREYVRWISQQQVNR
ncbi:MAG: endolytic transglycosylase MltG [Bacteroidetes bacterium]|nr:endolytic transglycosylase MltG [Bacteroidota bacterium]